MIYALVYVSSAVQTLKEKDIHKIFDYTINWNLDHNISGFLIYKGGNFIQLLEGNATTIKPLFERIYKDKRHNNPTVLLKEQMSQRSFDAYKCGFYTAQNKLAQDFLEYLDYLKLLESPQLDKMIIMVEQIIKAR